MKHKDPFVEVEVIIKFKDGVKRKYTFYNHPERKGLLDGKRGYIEFCHPSFGEISIFRMGYGKLVSW
jgi:hypothetical protein